MYSRLALITNEIAGLGSEEMTDKFIIKKILRALDGKYDTVCVGVKTGGSRVGGPELCV